MLEVKNLRFSYVFKHPVLKEISFKAFNSKLTALVGPNGSGKSTILKIIAGIIKYGSGNILIDGIDIENIPFYERSKIISYIPQKIFSLPEVSVFDAVMIGRKPYIRYTISQKDIKRVNEVLEELGLAGMSDKKVNEISGGELQKILIAQALVKDIKIILLDEPLNNLDIKNQMKIMSLVKKIAIDKNLVILIVIHDLNLALNYCDDFVFIKNGVVKYSLPAGEVNDNVIEDIFDVKLKVEKNNGLPFLTYN